MRSRIRRVATCLSSSRFNRRRRLRGERRQPVWRGQRSRLRGGNSAWLDRAKSRALICFPATAHKYLFVGDSELWFFAYEIPTSTYVAISRSTVRPVHRFSGLEALVNDMLAQAIGHFDEDSEDTSGALQSQAPKLPGTDFSLN